MAGYIKTLDICPVDIEVSVGVIVSNTFKPLTAKCPNKDKACLHKVEGMCGWVETGDIEKFTRIRDMPISKFSTKSKAAILDIKRVYMVDAYYQLVLSGMATMPKKEDKILDLPFPLDYIHHYWTVEVIQRALLYDNILNFRNTLNDKSYEHFIEIVEILTEKLKEISSISDKDN